MKFDILKEADYKYNFDRNIFFNREAKKAFSLEFVDDTSEEELRQSIFEKAGGDEWKFYFNFPPSEDAKHDLESVLN